jgi:hypothetical protein
MLQPWAFDRMSYSCNYFSAPAASMPKCLLSWRTQYSVLSAPATLLDSFLVVRIFIETAVRRHYLAPPVTSGKFLDKGIRVRKIYGVVRNARRRRVSQIHVAHIAF